MSAIIGSLLFLHILFNAREDFFLLPVKCDYISIGIGEESRSLIRKVHQNLKRPFEYILNNYYLIRDIFFRQKLILPNILFGKSFGDLKIEALVIKLFRHIYIDTDDFIDIDFLIMIFINRLSSFINYG